jgi:hypothetical protein
MTGAMAPAPKWMGWSVLTIFFRRNGTKPILQVTTLYLERTRLSAIASRSSYKIAYEFEDDLIKSPQGSRDYREEPGIST